MNHDDHVIYLSESPREQQKLLLSRLYKEKQLKYRHQDNAANAVDFKNETKSKILADQIHKESLYPYKNAYLADRDSSRGVAISERVVSNRKYNGKLSDPCKSNKECKICIIKNLKKDLSDMNKVVQDYNDHIQRLLTEKY